MRQNLQFGYGVVSERLGRVVGLIVGHVEVGKLGKPVRYSVDVKRVRPALVAIVLRVAQIDLLLQVLRELQRVEIAERQIVGERTLFEAREREIFGAEVPLMDDRSVEVEAGRDRDAGAVVARVVEVDLASQAAGEVFRFGHGQVGFSSVLNAVVDGVGVDR